jgi:hypothetical protein
MTSRQNTPGHIRKEHLTCRLSKCAYPAYRSAHKWACIFNDVTRSALQPKTIFVLGVLHRGVLCTGSPGTAPVAEMQINIFMRTEESEGRHGGGERVALQATLRR